MVAPIVIGPNKLMYTYAVVARSFFSSVSRHNYERFIAATADSVAVHGWDYVSCTWTNHFLFSYKWISWKQSDRPETASTILGMNWLKGNLINFFLYEVIRKIQRQWCIYILNPFRTNHSWVSPSQRRFTGSSPIHVACVFDKCYYWTWIPMSN